MEITFRNYSDDATEEFNLTLVPYKDSVRLLTSVKHLNSGPEILAIDFNKIQLKELIGALLHIQSKFYK